MAADSLTARSSSTSLRFRSLQIQTDMFKELEQVDGDRRFGEELPCPFCGKYLDILQLDFHIDQDHSMETNNGTSPVNAMKLGGGDMVGLGHLTLQHGNAYKIQFKRKTRRGGPLSTLSLSRKDMREANEQPWLGEPSRIASSSIAADEALWSSIISSMAGDDASDLTHFLSEPSSTKKSSNENVSERVAESVEDKEEKEKRSKFLQSILFSTIFLDNNI